MPNERLIRFTTPEDFERWLETNHADPDGLWLELAKKSAAFTTVTYAEAVDIALCWGWIDGQKGSIDEHRWKQRFTRRTAKSIWSKINRGKVEALIASKRMRPQGLAEVERAKADGRWSRAYDSPKTATAPREFTDALAKNAKAKQRFETLDAANRYAILFRVNTAKKPETKARRIADFVKELARGVVPHPERLPKKPRSKPR